MIYFSVYCLIFVSVATNHVESLKVESIKGGEDLFELDNNVFATILVGPERCSGGVLSSTHVITAASCVVANRDPVNPRFHTNIVVIPSVEDIDNAPPEYRLFVEQMYIPRAYFKGNDWNDGNIAVLKVQLQSGVDYGYIKPLALFCREKKVNGLGNVYGAGVTELPAGNARPQYSPKVLTSIADIYPKEYCRDNLPSIVKKTYNFLCASVRRIQNNVAGMCRGDIGAPLTVDRNNKQVLVGLLVQYTDKCDENAQPSKYIRISTTEHLLFVKRAKKDECDENMLCPKVIHNQC